MTLEGKSIAILIAPRGTEEPEFSKPKLICPPLSGPETMIVWTAKGTLNAEQEAQAGRDHRQAA